MQPYAHALISARVNKRDWEEDLPIHEFMDIAKDACPDLRHRAVLHNADLGPTLAALAFPSRPDAGEIAKMHVRQDLKRCPTLSDWFNHCDIGKLPRVQSEGAAGRSMVQDATQYLGLADKQPVQAIWDFLTMPSSLVPEVGEAANAILMNSVGPIIARSIFGPPKELPKGDGDTVMFDARWLCEGMIVGAVGRIPTLHQVMDSFDGKEPCSL